MGVWGQGSLRERRPGVFEIRIAVGVDPVSGKTVQRSFWFHGAPEDAEERRGELAAQFAEYRAVRRASPFLTVAELLERLSSLGEERRSSPHRQIHRAMENLRNSLRFQRQAGELVDEMVEQITDIIDEAARRIERL